MKLLIHIVRRSGMAMVPMIAVMINVSVIMEVLHRQLVVVLRME
jgi:hypothetical protein